MNAVFLRILLNGIIVVSIFFLPWWVTVSFTVFLLFVAQAFEVLLWGLLFDVLYSTSLPAFGNVTLLFTVSFFILFLVVVYSKRFLVFYSQ